MVSHYSSCSKFVLAPKIVFILLLYRVYWLDFTLRQNHQFIVIVLRPGFLVMPVMVMMVSMTSTSATMFRIMMMISTVMASTASTGWISYGECKDACQNNKQQL